MTLLGKLATSTASTSTILTILPVSDKNQELIVAFASSLIVQVVLKLAEHWQKKRRIKRIKRSYGSTKD